MAFVYWAQPIAMAMPWRNAGVVRRNSIMTRDYAILHKAMEAAWFALPSSMRQSPLPRADIMAEITGRLTACYDRGERDHDQLVRAGLEGVDHG